MHINAVLSHLGAWSKLQNDYPGEYQDIQQVVSNTDIKKTKMSRERTSHGALLYSPSNLHRQLMQGFADLGWQTKNRLRLGDGKGHRFSEVDVIKNAVGVELTFGKFAFAESNLFVKFPIFIQAHKLQIGCLLIASQSLTKSMPSGVSSFEMIRDRVAGLAPLPLKYPFAIIGLSDEPTSSSPQVQELTSELDQFLLDTVGYALSEMALLTERTVYDFKVRLPANKTTAKELCAFANLPGGGVILLGVDNAGRIKGIERVELDEIQLRIENIARDSCRPRPTVSFHVFDALSDPNRCVLVTRIDEVDRKPCVTSDRVYIRAGSSTRPADTDEIRRLVLSGEV